MGPTDHPNIDYLHQGNDRVLTERYRVYQQSDSAEPQSTRTSGHRSMDEISALSLSEEAPVTRADVREHHM